MSWWTWLTAKRVTLRWAAPTRYTDGTPIAAPVTYQVWAKEGYAPIASGLTTTAYVLRVPDDEARHCFYVRAAVGGHVSAGSNIACITT